MMAKAAAQPVKLDGPLDLELPDGSIVTVRPGPYKKGVAVIPRTSPGGGEAGTGQRGRKPRPGTVKLRQKLDRDAKAGRLKDAPTYFRWIISEDPTISHSVARQVVYRELRRVED